MSSRTPSCPTWRFESEAQSCELKDAFLSYLKIWIWGQGLWAQGCLLVLPLALNLRPRAVSSRMPFCPTWRFESEAQSCELKDAFLPYLKIWIWGPELWAQGCLLVLPLGLNLRVRDVSTRMPSCPTWRFESEAQGCELKDAFFSPRRW